MPRNVRNFWIELEVDGKKERVATGPRNREGGFQCCIKMRSDGQIFSENIVIEGSARSGLLKLTIFGKNNEPIFSRTTKA